MISMSSINTHASLFSGQSVVDYHKVNMHMMVITSLLILGMSIQTFSRPVVDTPYLSININREDLGSRFNMGVGRKNMNLEVSGRICWINFPLT